MTPKRITHTSSPWRWTGEGGKLVGNTGQLIGYCAQEPHADSDPEKRANNERLLRAAAEMYATLYAIATVDGEMNQSTVARDCLRRAHLLDD